MKKSILYKFVQIMEQRQGKHWTERKRVWNKESVKEKKKEMF